MNMLAIDLICKSSAEHLNQIYTGFSLLAQSGVAVVSMKKDSHYTPGITGVPRLGAVVNGKTRIIYDVGDGNTIDTADLDWCDFYFKRSYDAEFIRSSGLDGKVHPLGLNYPVYSKRGMFAWRRALWSILSSRNSRQFKLTLVQIGRSSRFFSTILRPQIGNANSNYQSFEALPRFDLPPTILFLARMWSPAGQENAIAAERGRINETRAELIRGLRKEFKQLFIGGVEESAFSRKEYPDCVVNQPEMTKRVNYLRRMKVSGICIATAGLLGSNGWKLAEYVAASKAIVSEKLNYQVPGDFLPGKNYLELSNVEECIRQIQYLLDHPRERYEMMVNNYRYYQAYLRPDMLVWNTLARALE